MLRKRPTNCRYEVVELDGVRYAIVREARLREICRRGGVEAVCSSTGQPRGRDEVAAAELDREALARRLILRRRRVGLTQAELARRAGVRGETLNRIERGRTTPDFATVRKLVTAMNQAEAELPGDPALVPATRKEKRRCQRRSAASK